MHLYYGLALTGINGMIDLSLMRMGNLLLVPDVVTPRIVHMALIVYHVRYDASGSGLSVSTNP